MPEIFSFYLSFALKLIVAMVAALLVLKFFSMKNQLKQMTPLDIVLNFVLSAILSRYILYEDISLWAFIGIMVIYGAFMYLISRFTFNTVAGRQFFVGRPHVIIRDGKCDVHMMKKMKVSASDVATVLRKQKINSIRDVDMAQIEPSGDLTVIKKGNAKYLPVLIDNGRVMTDALRQIQKTPAWLKKQLRTMGINDPSDVFIAQLSSRGLDVVKLK